MEILESFPMVNGLSAPTLTRKVSLSRHALPESIQAVILILGLLQLTAPANGVSTRVVFSGGTSVQEYDGSNTTPTVEYIRGSDEGGGVGGVLYTLRGTTPSYTHENRRGDVVAKTGLTGALTYQAQYEAYGNQIATNGSTLDRQKSNSKDTDPTGLVDEGFRYRDLETGSFLTRDPAGFVDGPNLYTYVNQNPWTSFDAEGLLTMMLNGQEVPWTVSNQAKVVVQNTKDLFGGFAGAAQHQASGLKTIATTNPVTTIGNVATSIGNGVKNFYNDPIGATTLPPGAFSPRGVGAMTENLVVGAATDGTVSALSDGAKLLTKAVTPTKSAEVIAQDTGKLHQPGYLPDDAPVVRGGSDAGTKSNPGGNTPAGIANGTATVPPGTPGAGLTGFSSQSPTGAAAGMSASDLANATVKNNSYGATTAGEIRAAGGDPVPTPRNNGTLQGSTHVTVTGLSPDTASSLLTPTVKKNP